MKVFQGSIYVLCHLYGSSSATKVKPKDISDVPKCISMQTASLPTFSLQNALHKRQKLAYQIIAVLM